LILLKNHIIIANNVLLAGHVHVEDNVTIGGGSAVHQHCRIGEHSFIGGMSGVVSDIVPYALFTGIREDGEINGINFVGLKRKGFSRETIHLISDCYHLIFSKEDRLQNNIDKAKILYKDNVDISKIIDFIAFNNSRNLCTNYRNKN
jgi:UDP-N-acetylglucosamine acyltransferase